jgi:putative Mg2+ transporter-C (MgtC) family protein
MLSASRGSCSKKAESTFLLIHISPSSGTSLPAIIFSKVDLRTYKIVSPYKENLLKDYEVYFKEHRLRFKRMKQSKIGNDITGSWIVQGSEKNHKGFVKRIMHDENVKEFEF